MKLTKVNLVFLILTFLLSTNIFPIKNELENLSSFKLLQDQYLTNSKLLTLIDSVVTEEHGGKSVYVYNYDNESRIKSIRQEYFGFYYDWDVALTTYLRDMNGYCTQKIIKEIKNGSTLRILKSLYEYDQDYNKVTEIDSSFRGIYKKTFVYNSDGYVIGQTNNNEDDVGKRWQSYYEWEYDEFNNILIQRYDTEDLITGRLYGWSKSYRYDELHRITRYQYYYQAPLNSNDHQTIVEYIYSTVGDLERKRFKSFGSSRDTTKWEIEYQYNNNDLFRIVNRTFNVSDSSFTPKEGTEYAYSANGDTTEILYLTWDGEWQNKNRVVYKYDSIGRCIQGSSEYWSLGDWIPLFKRIGFRSSDGKQYEFECNSFKVYYQMDRNINYSFTASRINNGEVDTLHNGSFIEGSTNILETFQIPEEFEKHQKQINIFKGSRFTIDKDALNENISLNVKFIGMDNNGNIINPMDNSPLFMFLGIEVTGEESGVTSSEEFYYFNEDKKARIIIPRTEEFLTLLEELEIDETNIGFAYVQGGEYLNEGLEWEIKDGDDGKVDSLCLYLDHFSKIVGGKNLLTLVNDEEENLPIQFSLEQNYPNPFNPVTTINYSVPVIKAQSHVSLQLIIYDVLGREIQNLVNEPKQAGHYSVSFDASQLSSGVYYYQLKAGEYIKIKKMVLMK